MAGQEKKRGGKRQCGSTSLLITKNPLITDITINDACITGRTIEGSVFLAPRWGVEQCPLVAQPEVVALLVKLGFLHPIPAPAVKTPLFVARGQAGILLGPRAGKSQFLPPHLKPSPFCSLSVPLHSPLSQQHVAAPAGCCQVPARSYEGGAVGRTLGHPRASSGAVTRRYLHTKSIRTFPRGF